VAIKTQQQILQELAELGRENLSHNLYRLEAVIKSSVEHYQRIKPLESRRISFEIKQEFHRYSEHRKKCKEYGIYTVFSDRAVRKSLQRFSKSGGLNLKLT